MIERSCYGCRFLCQGGDGTNACLQFDHHGELQGTNLAGFRPELIYEDCFTATVVRQEKDKPNE